MRRRGADFGDHRVLVVVTDADFGVALRCAFCMDDEFGRDLLRDVAAGEGDQCTAVVGADADDIARHQPLRRRNTRVERRCEVAVAHDVAERRRAVVGSVDHRTAEAAALRYVDFLDRCAGGCVPRAQAFEQLPAAVRERQTAWVVGPDAARAAVEQMDALAPVSERERQRHADWSGAEDEDVGIERFCGRAFLCAIHRGASLLRFRQWSSAPWCRRRIRPR